MSDTCDFDINNSLIKKKKSISIEDLFKDKLPNSKRNSTDSAVSEHKKIPNIENFVDIILSGLNELRVELKLIPDNIIEIASDFISTKEIILIYGKSKVVETFIIGASKHRKFEVIVVLSPPN